jgi:hypothetical protein
LILHVADWIRCLFSWQQWLIKNSSIDLVDKYGRDDLFVIHSQQWSCNYNMPLKW